MPTPPSNFPGPRDVGRMPELDGLRAIAILLVLVFHVTLPLPSNAIRTLTGIGWTGVDLFFVISGFLIGGILMDNRAASNYYRVFYLRRFLRIVPLYALVITPALVIVCLGLGNYFPGHSIEQSSAAVWLYPLFLQNFGAAFLLALPKYLGAAWSLAVEEQFYLFIAPLVRRFSSRSLARVAIVGIISAPIIRAALFLLFGDRAGIVCYNLLPTRWDSLLMGVLAAWLVRDSQWRTLLVGHLKQLRLAWLVLAIGMAAMTASGRGWDNVVIAIAGYAWIAAFFSVTLLLAHLHPVGSLNQFLSWSPFRPIATVSYGLYLLQGPVFAVVEAPFRHHGTELTGWTAVGVNLLALAATALAAALSWRFFESRCLRYAHRFAYQPSPTKPL